MPPALGYAPSSGTWIQSTAIEADTVPAHTYNLTIANTHTYHVKAGAVDTLVHNCSKTVDELAELEPIHWIDPDKIAPLKSLSDDDLIRSFNNPADGSFAAVTDDGRIMNGHHRIIEIINRAADPRSSITGSTRVRIERHFVDNSEFWDM